MLECLLKEFTSLIKMYDVTKIKSLYFGGGGKIILHLYTYNKPSMVGFFCPKKLDEESDSNPPPSSPDLCKNWSGLCAKFEIRGTTENVNIQLYVFIHI